MDWTVILMKFNGSLILTVLERTGGIEDLTLGYILYVTQYIFVYFLFFLGSLRR